MSEFDLSDFKVEQLSEKSTVTYMKSLLRNSSAYMKFSSYKMEKFFLQVCKLKAGRLDQ